MLKQDEDSIYKIKDYQESLHQYANLVEEDLNTTTPASISGMFSEPKGLAHAMGQLAFKVVF